MIEVSVYENKMIIKGHAGLADEGSDIVCAAVSILWYAITEKMYKENIKIELREQPGLSEMALLEKNKKKIKLARHIVDTAICGLEEICEQYPENVSLKKMSRGGL